MKYILICSGLVILFCNITFAQSEKEISKALKHGFNGVNYTNKGLLDSALIEFDKAIKLDPASMEYPYEKALIYYQKKEYKTAASMFDSLLKHPNANDHVYQMLGNCYDMQDQKEKAIEIYKAGLEKFPNSGRLYMELGLVQQKILLQSKESMGKSYGSVLNFWEKGVELDPAYEYNYYYLSSYYSKTAEKVWGLIYGEVFLNQAVNKQRISEISQMVFQTAKTAFFYKTDSSTTIRFTAVKTLSENIDLNKIRFEQAYEFIMTKASTGIFKKESDFNLKNWVEVRENFIKLWYEFNLHFRFPNMLFDWQKKLYDAKLYDVYNYNIFSSAEPDGFRLWYSKNRKKQEKLAEWLKSNPLEFSTDKKVFRFQYDK